MTTLFAVGTLPLFHGRARMYTKNKMARAACTVWIAHQGLTRFSVNRVLGFEPNQSLDSSNGLL
jgi:hypothetical protein